MSTPATDAVTPIDAVRRARPSRRKSALVRVNSNQEAPSSDTSSPLRASEQLTPSLTMSVSGDHSTESVGPSASDNQTVCAAALTPSCDEAGLIQHATPVMCASLIAEIRETHRRRQDFHRAEKSLTLQIKAIERRLGAATKGVTPALSLPRDSSNGADQRSRDTHASNVCVDPLGEGHPATETLNCGADASEVSEEVQIASDDHHARDNLAHFATLPLQEARATIKKHRLEVERRCVKLAKELPVYAAFVEPINGFGALGLAQIVGEAGDLANYANPGKLWKRMGLAVFDGKSQRRVSGAAAIEQGYSPVRRAIMFCIGDSLLKKQNAYRDLYLERKAYEQAKVPDGTKMLWHRRAQRYVEKRLLRELWKAWRDAHASN